MRGVRHEELAQEELLRDGGGVRIVPGLLLTLRVLQVCFIKVLLELASCLELHLPLRYRVLGVCVCNREVVLCVNELPPLLK